MNNLNLIKSLAILSVVVAHVDIQVSNNIFFSGLKIFYGYFGAVGVGFFFIIVGSAILERVVPMNSNVRRVKGYLLPWFISGSVVYLYLYLRKPSLPFTYFSFILGNGSYLYFMTVLVLFLLLGSFARYHFVRFFLLISSLIYLVFGLKIMPVGFSEHLNIMLWMPYFLFGRVIGKNLSVLESICSLEFILIAASVLIWCALIQFGVVSVSMLNYQSPILVASVCFIFLLIVSLVIPCGFELLGLLGRNTLSVYLWHMPVIGVLNYFSNKWFSYLHVVSPLLVILTLLLLIRIVGFFQSILPGFKFKTILGFN